MYWLSTCLSRIKPLCIGQRLFSLGTLLIVYEVDDFKEVFASEGKVVMHVRYFGYADINTIIESTGHKRWKEWRR